MGGGGGPRDPEIGSEEAFAGTLTEGSVLEGAQDRVVLKDAY